jgi:hypothetical protein
MTEKINTEELIIDAEFEPALTEESAEKLKTLQAGFIKNFVENKDRMSVEEWLPAELRKNLPDIGDAEIHKISGEIIETIRLNNAKKHDLEKAIGQGRSKESWFASECVKACSHYSAQEASKYLRDLDNALKTANTELFRTITTIDGNVSGNLHLDGFIAEQHHAQTFNLNAKARGSAYHAEVLQPDGVYGKNSVDIVIKDADGKIVKRYQSKYCKDSEATLKAFADGDYRGQRKLVADGQETDIKNSVNKIEIDGVSSKPLSKIDAKKMQEEAQSGNWSDLNWNEYAAKDLALGIGKQAGRAAAMGAAVGTGFYLAEKVMKGEQIDGQEVVETLVTSGVDFGVKSAAAGALKVGVERGIVSVIPKGTPAAIIADIVCVGIESAKALGKVATGELTVAEGIEKIEQTAVSTAAGVVTAAKGTAIGATLGLVLGPVGSVVGSAVGGMIGYMAGSKVGEVVIKGMQKVRRYVCETVRKVTEKIKEVGESVIETVASIGNAIADFFGF